jgi:hypothetical protein
VRGVILFVAYAMRVNNTCRIIDATRASRRERAGYTLQTGRDPKPESRTDWDRLNRMSDKRTIRRGSLSDAGEFSLETYPERGPTAPNDM